MRIEVRNDEAADGPTNMALDRDLLAEAGLIARVYSWSGPWISLGRFQNAERDLIRPQTPFVMRPTGGKAVLHGHDATIALAAPLALIGCSQRDVKSAYRAICGPLVSALRSCGLNAALAEETNHVGKGSRTADCFAFNSPNDIVDRASGKKVCGCALLLTESALLVQASIPCGQPLVDPREFLREAGDYVGSNWDRSNLAPALEAVLRYNFAHV
jgi:lipoate-protein ligase A